MHSLCLRKRNLSPYCYYQYYLTTDSQDIIQLGTVTTEFFENDQFPVTQCVTIGTIDDNSLEGHHNFSIAITSVEPVGGIVFSDPPSISTLEVVIIDNEGMYSSTFKFSNNTMILSLNALRIIIVHIFSLILRLSCINFQLFTENVVIHKCRSCYCYI